MKIKLSGKLKLEKCTLPSVSQDSEIANKIAATPKIPRYTVGQSDNNMIFEKMTG